ncbi:MAG: ChbG/HpnK family deacetylase [Burkholderiales bacterium]|nr:ChbG/HpnK family deacetylase [Burkholderiales bacterium]
MVMAATRQLVVCVDDFGLHAGVNQAVLDLLGQRRISAVSCLVDGETWARDAAALKVAAYASEPAGGAGQTGRQADIGLHLNLTECLDPVAQAAWPSQPLGALIQAAYWRRLDPAALRIEIARQWDRFVAVWGQAPDFVDGHQHVHQLPQVREALMAVLDSRLAAGAARPWLRRCRAPGWRAIWQGISVADTLKAHIISVLGSAALARLARARGLRTTEHLLGVYPFDADAPAYLSRWQGWLQLARPQGDLLMCHPAKPGVAAGPVEDVIAASRAMEYQVLTGAEWERLLVRASVRVTTLA